MKRKSTHYDWLRLIEVSGPFLSPVVLDEAFPAGLDGLDKHVKRDLSHFYDEWIEAREARSRDFAELHEAWLRVVLGDGLGFKDGDLEDGSSWEVKGDGGLGSFAADLSLKGVEGTPVLFIKFLPADVKPTDRNLAEDWKDTCIEKMTRLCRAHNVRIGLVSNGEQWVLVNATSGGALSGYATWYARLWFQEDETLRAFLAFLGYHRFAGAPKKRLPYLLDESLNHLEEVTDTLGKQVMTAVEVLLEGLDRADVDSGRTLLSDVSPSVLYEASLTVMMRLVFLLCAEERGLLLLGEKLYDDVYAVSTLRRQLEEDEDRFGAQVLERRFDAWVRLLSTFRAVYHGIDHPSLKLPAMGGSLFNPDKYPFLEGRKPGTNWASENPSPIPIDNRTVLLLLESLQVLKHKDGAIPLSFRSLDVEQIGYIYEGLLEFTGARADTILLGLKGDKSHLNPEVALSELESLRMDSEDKLIDFVKETTGRTAVAREYASEADVTLHPLLMKVCRGDTELAGRITPFLNWMRLSEWGEPVVYHKDSFFVTEGRDRRSSGTHYTPKVLTEMIVKEALEPVAYVGPALGTPRAEWKLKTPAELMDLKVCDPAMGSGAFLVQACRYLSDRLVESWSIAEKGGMSIASNGSVVETPPRDAMSNLPDDRICEARRLIAERCLYGVDINPLAVELAKLSLWLITISKGRPFNFLDHNLKFGDSLLGVSDINQLIQFRMKPSASGFGNLMTNKIESSIAEAAAEREAIRTGRNRDISDIALQQQHYRKAEALTQRIKEYADFFIGEVFVAGKPGKKTDRILDAAAIEGAGLLTDDSLKLVILRNRTKSNLAYDLPLGQTAPRRPFHWAIEFPEVFSQGGFNAIVGNPPFVNAVELCRGTTQPMSKLFYQFCFASAIGSYDLYVLFYERAVSLIRRDGIVGLLTPNKILSADYAVGLRQVLLRYGSVRTILDFTSGDYFAASVYTLSLVFQKFSQGKLLYVKRENKDLIKIEYNTLHKMSDQPWGFLLTGESELFTRMIVDSQCLGSIANVSGTATVAEAYEIAPHIEECDAGYVPLGYVRFIVSGNIKPYGTSWGIDTVQYLKHAYHRPVIAVRKLPHKRGMQALAPKIAMSGLAKYPVAFLDEEGEFYPGKSTVIISAESLLLLRNLTVLLNSKVAKILYHAQYCSLALQGGYMRFGSPQIERFPVPKGFELIKYQITEDMVADLYHVTNQEVVAGFERAYTL